MDLFSAPVPGQSLTQEVGAAPYEQPPQFADVNDALEHMFEKLSDKRQATRLVILLKKGVPVEYIVRTIVYEGFLKNKWTPDTGLLMSRILMAMIIAIGEAAGVKKMVIFNPDKEQEEFLNQFIDDDDLMEEPEEPEVESKFTMLPAELSGVVGAQM